MISSRKMKGVRWITRPHFVPSQQRVCNIRDMEDLCKHRPYCYTAFLFLRNTFLDQKKGNGTFFVYPFDICLHPPHSPQFVTKCVNQEVSFTLITRHFVSKQNILKANNNNVSNSYKL